MNPPPAPKIRRSIAKLDSLRSSQSSDQPPSQGSPASTKRQELTLVAEVHNSKSKLIVSSEDEDWERTKERRKRRPKTASSLDNARRKFREPRKGYETDTLSEVESGGESSKLKKQHRLPRKGSLTDTLSEASDFDLKQPNTLIVPQIVKVKKHKPPRRGSATDTLSEESTDSGRPTDAERLSSGRTSISLDVPIPVPRLSVETTFDSKEAFSDDSLKSQPHRVKSSSLESLEPPQPPPIRPKKEKTKKTKESENEQLGFGKGQACEDEIKTDSEPVTDYLPLKTERSNDWVCVTVHGCDPLKFMDFCRNPAVRVYTVDPLSGKRLDSRSRPGETLPPLETKPFSLKIHRTVHPRWEEDLIIRESMDVIASKETLLLLEVFEGSAKGKVIAWGFLKLVAANGANNIAKPLRLQLFKPNKSIVKNKKDIPSCYNWWTKGKYSLYKSTLYVTVNPIPISEVETSCLSIISDGLPLSDEKVSVDKVSSNGVIDDLDKEVVWSRYPGQSCKLPNMLTDELDCGRDGALCLKFSHSGRLLAAPAQSAILIYTIPNPRVYLTLTNHQGIVYDLAWSENDDYLLSASADSTACVWDIKHRLNTPLRILSHPSYVYSNCWLGNTLATGCFDGQIRIWDLEKDTPTEYLTKHRSRVNSVASTCQVVVRLDDEIETTWSIVSGDSSGIIYVWKQQKDQPRLFELTQEIKIREIVGQVINRLKIVADGKRLLVQTRDSLIRMVDIATTTVLQWYEGGVNVKVMGSMEVCGCGRRVWCSSEDGALCIWDYGTGARLALYSIRSSRVDSCFALALHPKDHILAYVPHLPNDHPTLKLLKYDKDADNSDVGLIILDPYKREGSTVNNTCSTLGVSKWSALGCPLYEIPSVRIQAPPGAAKILAKSGALSPKSPSSGSRNLTPEARSPAAPYSRSPKRLLSPARSKSPSGGRLRSSPSWSKSPRASPSPALSRLSPGDRGGRKVKSRSVTPTSFVMVTRSFSGEPPAKDTTEPLILNTGPQDVSTMKSMPSPTQLPACNEQPSEKGVVDSRDSRLSDIIEKMDMILLQASPKQVSAVK